MSEDAEPTGESDRWDSEETLLKTAPELELVAQLLAEGHSDAAAALAVGREAKYVQRARRSNPAFATRVRELKEHRAVAAAAGLGALLDEAIAAVRRGLYARRPADQLRAAALVLDRYRAFLSDSEAVERLGEMQHDIDELRDSLTSLSNSETAEESRG